MNTPETTAHPSEFTNALPKSQFWDSRTVKDWIVAFSMANWMLIRVWSNLLSGASRFFSKQPVVRPELLALACGIGMFTVIIWLGLTVSRRFTGPVSRMFLDLAFLGLLIIPADFIRRQFSLTGGDLIGFAKHPAGLLCFLAIAGLIVWKHRWAAQALAIVAGITCPLALFTLARIVLLCVNITHPKDCACEGKSPPVLPVRQGQTRVLWIIFDETDYRLAFEQRPPSVKLPEFDRLQAESLSAANAYPPQADTIISMPALISGRSLSSVEVKGCQLELTLHDTGEKKNWSEMPSVFSSARDLGVNTAAVGWYVPYELLLGPSLNYCSWYPYPFLDLVSSATFAGSIHQQMASLVDMIHARQLFIDDCNGTLNDGLSVVTNRAYSLILLHLPPPHEPYVFVPEKNEFTLTMVTGPKTYFNNLALADRELGVLRKALETSGLQENTWTILSADHSWRKSKRYDGKRDYRVPYLVKSPRTNTPTNYPRQFNTIVTHDLILAILRGDITNQMSVAPWLDVHGKPDLPILKQGQVFEQ